MGTEGDEKQVLNEARSLKRGEDGQGASKLGASRKVGIDNCRKKLVRGKRGGGPSIGFHPVRFATLGARERCFVFPFSVKDQCAVQPSKVRGRTSTNCLMDLLTSWASLARVILWGSMRQSYVRN